ncbi:AraC family transcriptional regulator [Streptococcus oricebi]|uniref:AraC family transcriptional regulator n=1 Tax=Streptococcus oricebi TaxID=1547447 RepID=A0ABS5B5B1_9STRE|nr:AraC family transcriptional regulator [Streptococcus oricebi]MBP2623999.1 AraC family transcriptional regulator [Streptococcus oricebi]
MKASLNLLTLADQSSLLQDCLHFSSHGQTYFIDQDKLAGFHWIYETLYFSIHIHDLQVKEDFLASLNFEEDSNCLALSSYLKAVSGENLLPYQSLNSQSSLSSFKDQQDLRLLLHAHSNFQAISLAFKESMIDEYLTDNLHLSQQEIQKIFQNSQQLTISKLEKIAEEISHYKLTSLGSELFYEIKAREWLSLLINDYYQQKSQPPLTEADDLALSSVSTYIKEHFAKDISQDLLAQIAMMSKTKLKTAFKSKYHMTLTEFIQRRRISMAKQLLITTPLNIKEVALSVGYQSHSRFSSLFKKYTGLYPRQVRKQAEETRSKSQRKAK